MEFKPTDHPIENELPKLVRDNIPAIIEKNTGLPANMRIAEDDAEYLTFLLKKIGEEAAEVNFSAEHGNLQEELADVLEIIDAILLLNNWTREDILKIQKEKREKNGGF